MARRGELGAESARGGGSGAPSIAGRTAGPAPPASASHVAGCRHHAHCGPWSPDSAGASGADAGADVSATRTNPIAVHSSANRTGSARARSSATVGDSAANSSAIATSQSAARAWERSGKRRRDIGLGLAATAEDRLIAPVPMRTVAHCNGIAAAAAHLPMHPRTPPTHLRQTGCNISDTPPRPRACRHPVPPPCTARRPAGCRRGR